jgi:hypothetical protein
MNEPLPVDAATDRSLGESLLREGVINDAQLKHALEFQRTTGGELREILPKLGYVREAVIVQYIARQKHMHFIDPETAEVDQDLMGQIPRTLIEKHLIVPLKGEHGIVLALSDPDDFAAIDEIQFLSSRPIDSALAPRASIRKAINQFYQSREEARRKPIAAAGAGADERAKIMALSGDALLRGLVLALIDKGVVDAESVLAHAPPPTRR